ncbi:hypothetical protein BCR39DRAFT_533849 [Naematelia encephala]|uniref:Phospholipid/glycerol acyltransferase domain-containing protein n=1 Tax=Naematelia encephala TaxID=71784 RepID=A0A1Y2B3X7_9TREE|nr:hypothetical protein BCR39DRAFT_533849 [Naematelia encephala]
MALNRRLISHTLALIPLISIANTFLLFALLIKPFSEPSSWSLACWTAEWFWRYMQNHWEINLNAGPVIYVTGDPLPYQESAIVISNHLSFSDYYLVQHLAVKAGMLGRCRYFAKKELVRIPIFGWAFWAIGMILVSRNWTDDASSIQAAFSRIKHNAHDVWIVLYPEGTRRTPRKVLASQVYARQNDKRPLDHLLQPRTKGFVATIQGKLILPLSVVGLIQRRILLLGQDMKIDEIPAFSFVVDDDSWSGLHDSHVRYVYDMTTRYVSPHGDVVPSLGELLGCADLARAGYEFHVHVRRIPIEDLPMDEVGLKRWCEKTWEYKDEMLGNMLRAEKYSRKGFADGHGHDHSHGHDSARHPLPYGSMDGKEGGNDNDIWVRSGNEDEDVDGHRRSDSRL